MAAPAADAPVAGAFHDHFFGPDPCTGTLDEITVTGLPVTNQTVFRQSLRDVLVNEETGARMRAGFIFVVDLATGDVKVLHGGISCIHD